MNKKLLIGLSSIGMAAGFWACGSGSIEPMDEGTDVYVDAMLNTLDFTSQTERAMKACDEDLVCANEMAKAAHGSIEFSSESSLPVSSDDGGQPIVSSSSESFFKFSSLGDVGFQSSSSDAGTLVSSSSEQIIITGIGRCYPHENRALEKAMLQCGGAIISELPFNRPPNAFHFPRRNRIIAALSQPVVVVEGETKSGALITAKLALEMGKDVLAVPGPIDSPQSSGPNSLVRDGAGVVTSVADILDYIPQQYRFGLDTRFFERPSQAAEKPEENLSAREQQVMQTVADGQLSLDQVALALGAGVPETAALLFDLEVKGFLACENGLYSKSKF